MKIIKNACYGGYNLSDYAISTLSGLTGLSFSKCEEIYNRTDEIKIRARPELVQTVEDLGKLANGRCANLVVVEVPDDIALKCYIEDYDGWETIEEPHRSW